MKKIRLQLTAPTTTPGFENENGQVVLRSTGFQSASFPGQKIYHLRCRHCGFEYGANGTDVAKRLCPSHQGGAVGEKLREMGPGLFD